MEVKRKHIIFALVATLTLSACKSSEPQTILENGHEWVDLGLSVKWASMNLGANIPEDAGYYIAWGETAPQPSMQYDWSSYHWMNPGQSTYKQINKYTIPDSYTDACWFDNGKFIGDNLIQLELNDDAAHVLWGGRWRMPTREDYIELVNKCTFEWTMQKGIAGCRVTGPNGAQIFLPAAGRIYQTKCNYGEESVYFWLSNLSNLGNRWAFCVDIKEGYVQSLNDSQDRSIEHFSGINRCYGLSIRAVCP